jgi:hypothetical protein
MISDRFLTFAAWTRETEACFWRKAAHFQRVLKERATGLEPATSSLEGWRSTN